MNIMKPEPEMIEKLAALAEEQFGKSRAGELRPDLEQMSAELAKLASFPLQTTDEP